MGRLARAAVIGAGTRGLCDCHLYPPVESCPHSRKGVILTCSDDVLIEGVPAVRDEDTGLCNCPHFGIEQVCDVSDKVFINGKGAARIRDGTRCMNPICQQEASIVDTSVITVFFG